MKRLAALLLVVAMLVLATGCDNVEVDSPEAGNGTSSDAETESEEPAAGFEPIPVDGPGESAAVAALPEALEQAKAMRESGGFEWPNLDGAEPVLTAHIITVEMNGQVALFEVRADGIPHSLYAYQKAFDAATLVWTPAEYSTSPRVAPQSVVEQGAVTGVESAMRDSFPDSAMSTSVYGYRFVYVRDGEVALTLEIGTDGAVISVG